MLLIIESAVLEIVRGVEFRVGEKGRITNQAVPQFIKYKY